MMLTVCCQDFCLNMSSNKNIDTRVRTGGDHIHVLFRPLHDIYGCPPLPRIILFPQVLSGSKYGELRAFLTGDPVQVV